MNISKDTIKPVTYEGMSYSQVYRDSAKHYLFYIKSEHGQLIMINQDCDEVYVKNGADYEDPIFVLSTESLTFSND